MESGTQIGEDWSDEVDIGEDWSVDSDPITEAGKKAVYAIALSPNGKTVASGGYDGKVRLWDIETGKVVAKQSGHTEVVESVRWSADGERVLSGCLKGTARKTRYATRKHDNDAKHDRSTLQQQFASKYNTATRLASESEQPRGNEAGKSR
ncbi:quinon protein alcohol dehydrogenase-like superfamily [Suillus lakei]|nr:quinon protein alcohol dehydrogenase-like superfamily [Suillus lakei]